jgi:hypothetical protein
MLKAMMEKANLLIWGEANLANELEQGSGS